MTNVFNSIHYYNTNPDLWKRQSSKHHTYQRVNWILNLQKSTDSWSYKCLTEKQKAQVDSFEIPVCMKKGYAIWLKK